MNCDVGGDYNFLFASDVGAIRVLPPHQLGLKDLSVVGVSISRSELQFYDPSHRQQRLGGQVLDRGFSRPPRLLCVRILIRLFGSLLSQPLVLLVLPPPLTNTVKTASSSCFNGVICVHFLVFSVTDLSA